MNKTIAFHFLIILLIVGVILPSTAFAQRASGFVLVPCGRVGQTPCQFKDLISVIVRIINLLLAASVIIAMYYILLSGWGMMTALGNAEKIAQNREGLSRALMGFTIVLLSFAFINLLVQGIFGLENCSWWSNPLQLWGSQSCLIPG